MHCCTGNATQGLYYAWEGAVREPSWIDVKGLRADVSGVACEFDWTGRYLNFGDLKPGDTITLTFPIAEKELRYTVNAHTQWEQEYKCVFRGSTLVDISPRDDSPTSYPMYLRSHMRTSETPMRQVERFVPKKVVCNW